MSESVPAARIYTEELANRALPLVRRIVEHYIQEHAPRRGAKRSKS